MESEKSVGAADTADLVVLLHFVGLDVAMPDEEGHGLSDVDALFDRCQMVGEYGYADGLVPRANLIIYRGDEPLVKILDGTELQFEVAVVAGLVAGFNMDEDKVLCAQRLDGGLCLTQPPLQGQILLAWRSPFAALAWL